MSKRWTKETRTRWRKGPIILGLCFAPLLTCEYSDPLFWVGSFACLLCLLASPRTYEYYAEEEDEIWW